MTTGLLILMLTLGNARKEATLRWGAGQWELKTNVTTTSTKYELYVTVNKLRHVFSDLPRCVPEVVTFTGPSWQSVMDQSKGLVSECTGAVNIRK